MKNNPLSIGAQNVKTCEQALHLGKLCVSGTEKGRERKGIVCPRGSLVAPFFHQK